MKGTPRQQLLPYIHARRLKPETALQLAQHRDFLEEFTVKELALPRRLVNTDHVPVFYEPPTRVAARSLGIAAWERVALIDEAGTALLT